MSPLVSSVLILAFVVVSTLLMLRKGKEHAVRYVASTVFITALVFLPIYALLVFESADPLNAWVTLGVSGLLVVGTCYFTYKRQYLN